ncbi:hypothetical protein LTR53_019558, partial [Teratosphaeriaceae sp. CCFEE 6253]
HVPRPRLLPSAPRARLRRHSRRLFQADPRQMALARARGRHLRSRTAQRAKRWRECRRGGGPGWR